MCVNVSTLLTTAIDVLRKRSRLSTLVHVSPTFGARLQAGLTSVGTCANVETIKKNESLLYSMERRHRQIGLLENSMKIGELTRLGLTFLPWEELDIVNETDLCPNL